MGMGNLYTIILVIVVISITLGAGIILLDKMELEATGYNPNTSVILNETRDALSPISSSWLPIIVIIAAAIIILFFIMRLAPKQR